MRVLSGIQPSGNLHLGNYFGMMRPMLAEQGRNELFCFIVNYHALTSSTAGQDLRKQTLEAAADFLALGLDPRQTCFWVQSDLPEVCELTWILSNVTGMGLLERCHSYKDKVAQGLKPHHGLFAYPVLMTADILLMQGQRIPVGMDQKQHVEVARDIALRFNRQVADIFTVPEPQIFDDGGMLPGIDGRKMSKSYENTIEIFSDKETLKNKLRAFKTDSTPIGQSKSVETNSLYRLYMHFLKADDRVRLRQRFESPGLKYSEIKDELVEVIWEFFAPYRQRREELASNPSEVVRILGEGAEKARLVASETLARVRHAVGIDYKEGF